MIKAPTPKGRELFFLRIIILGALAYSFYFLNWFFDENYIANYFLFSLITIMILYRFLRLSHQWIHLFFLPRHRSKKSENKHYSVDVFTTYVPGEPYEMVENTLLAIKNIKYPHGTFLCSEGDDARMQKFCEQHGITFVPRYERVNAKAGNVNNALKLSNAEISIILDPDHAPSDDFIDVVLPHFADEQIGFVQVPQVYENQDKSFIAKGAAQQTYEFYGPLMQATNKFGTTPAIGANCSFRREALDSIGGHAPGLTEDMHTSMLLHSKGWKSIYVPEVVSKGRVPVNLSSYFKQQLKWSRGSFDLIFHVFPKIFKQLSWSQRFHYLSVPLYFLFGLLILVDFFVPTYSLFSGEYPLQCRMDDLVVMIAPLVAISFFIKLYAQRWYYERHEKGLHFFGEVLRISTWWYNVLGFVYTIIGKKVPYIPTPKEDQLENEIKISIPNIVAVVIMLLAIMYGLNRDWSSSSILMSCYLAILASILFTGVMLGLGDFWSKLRGGINSFSNVVFWIVKRTSFLMIFVTLLINIAYFSYFRDHINSLRPIHPPRIGNTGGLYMLSSDGASNLVVYDSIDEKSIYEEMNKGKFPIISLNLQFRDSAQLIQKFDSLKLDQLKANYFLDVFNHQDSLIARSCHNIWRIANEYFMRQGVNPTMVFSCDNILEMRNCFPNRRYVDWIMYKLDNIKDVDELYHELDDLSHDFYLRRTPVLLKTNLNLTKAIVDSILFDFKEVRGIITSGRMDDIEEDQLAKNLNLITSSNLSSSLKIPPFRGVYYNVSQDWKDEFQTLTRKSIRYDFQRIKEAGANTILRYGPTLGDKNIIEIAKQEKLDIVYGFQIDASVDFTDNKKYAKVRDDILVQFNNLKIHDNIIAWQFGKNTLERIEGYNVMPYSKIQKCAYLNFVSDIAKYIHDNDHRPVAINTVLDDRIYLTKRLMDLNAKNIDLIGLDVYHLEDFKHLSNLSIDKNKIFFSSVGSEGYADFLRNNIYQVKDFDSTVIQNIPIEKTSEEKGRFMVQCLDSVAKYSQYGGFVNCWSDKMDGSFTWSGITDYKGRKKPKYYYLKQVWTNQEQLPEFPIIKIENDDDYIIEGDEFQFKLTMNDPSKYQHVSWVLAKNGFIPMSSKYIKNQDKFTVQIKIPDDDSNLSTYVLYAFVADGNNENVITSSYLLPLRWYYK